LYRFNITRLLLPFYKKIFNPKGDDKVIYLTFDDGPNFLTTQEILNVLNDYNIKATFFCLGENVEKEKDFFEILQKDHAVGNHGYSHLNGFKISGKAFVENIEKADLLIKSSFFRPPYGKITPLQYHQIKDKYTLVLWSDMPGDFDVSISKERLLDRLKAAIYPFSIIVLHDNIQSLDKLLYALPKFIEEALQKGYTFKTIS
jgi:peptidoglycan/xylan/chitin deacetylase (PgdA/CDA1 family)